MWVATRGEGGHEAAMGAGAGAGAGTDARAGDGGGNAANAKAQDATAGAEEDLVCLRCGAKPEQVVWSEEVHAFLHARRGRTSAQSICGGEVVARGDEWRRLVAPGAVVLCRPATRSFRAHFVRLGRRLHARNGSWSGTALCGAEPPPGVRWVPIPLDNVDDADTCGACRNARARGNGR